MPKGFETGVSYYTRAALYWEFGFPEDRTTCQWCPFSYSEPDLKRWRCRITRDFLLHPFTERGVNCPVYIIPKDGEEKNETSVESN